MAPEQHNRKYARICLILLFVNFLLIFSMTNHTAMKIVPSKSSTTGDDYHKLINVSFEFKHVPKICTNLTSKFLVAVHTAPKNVEKRQTIRETWGAFGAEKRVLFMVGEATDEATKKKLQEEIAAHDDFVQGDFVDSYSNLTYKHAMVFKYVVYHCQKVEYLLKVDDDAFVNMPNFEDFIEQYSIKYKNSTDILCYLLTNAKVLRSGKWAVSKEYYPHEKYPPYCLGYSVIYPISTVFKLYVAVQAAPYYWIDDVHITGILPHNLGIRHKKMQPLLIDRKVEHSILSKKYNDELFPFVFSYVNMVPANIRLLWDYVLKRVPKTNMLDYIETR